MSDREIHRSVIRALLKTGESVPNGSADPLRVAARYSRIGGYIPQREPTLDERRYLRTHANLMKNTIIGLREIIAILKKADTIEADRLLSAYNLLNYLDNEVHVVRADIGKSLGLPR